MSGIAAVFQRDGAPVERETMGRMVAALQALGPNGISIRVDGPVGLAHLLHRFTPEDSFERQPLQGESGAVLAFDGRLDNRDDLAEALGIGQTVLAGLADSDLVLRAFERWGVDSFRRLIGPYALVIWEPRQRRLIAARDPMGGRPLCFYAANNRVAFASMPRGLHALGWFPRTLDEARLADFLVDFTGDPAATFFADVTRLQPGRYMIVTADRVDSGRFWSFDEIEDIRLPNDDDYVEAFLEVFDRAVTAQLRSSGDVGTFMSGGLDSSAIAVTAVRYLPSRQELLPAFTSVPEREHQAIETADYYDDATPFVEAIAAMTPRLELHLVRSEGLGIFHRADEFMHALEAPSRNINNQCWYFDILSRARERGVEVMLDGDLGNSTISHDGLPLLTELLRSGRWRTLWREFHSLPKDRSRIAGSIVKHAMRHYAPDALWRSFARYRHRRSWPWGAITLCNPQFATKHDRLHSPRRHDFNSRHKLPSHDPLYQRQRIERLISPAGEFSAAFAAVFGIDVRDPSADRRVAAFCLAIPQGQYLHRGTTRWLIRRAMAGRLPAMVANSSKVGGQATDWLIRLRRDRKRIFETVESLSGRAARESVDMPRIKQLLADWDGDDAIVADGASRRLLQQALPCALSAVTFVDTFGS